MALDRSMDQSIYTHTRTNVSTISRSERLNLNYSLIVKVNVKL